MPWIVSAALSHALNASILLYAMVGMIPAHAGELTELYQQAETVDPVYREVVQQRRVADEAMPQARAGLLPRVSIDGSINRNWQQIEASDDGLFGGTQNIKFNAHNYSLNLRQPVYQRARIQRLRQAGHTGLQALAAEKAARLNLMTRLSSAYFNILSARANLDFAHAEKRALGRQLDQAKQRMELGLATSVDFEEAKAGHDQSVARELQAENDLAIATERLREITGDVILAEDLRLDPSMPLEPPEPDDLRYWVQQVRSDNPNVSAAREQMAVAEKAVEVARSDHQPSLDIIGRQAFQSSGGRFGTTDITGTTLGLELNVPIYEGGGVSSRVRQARHELAAARERLEQIQRVHERQARESYISILNDIQRTEALQQAVRSARTALRATRAGFEVGTRASVDVVTAEQNLSKAQRDHTQARHSYVINRLMLKQAAGHLKTDDLETIDRWIHAAGSDN